LFSANLAPVSLLITRVLTFLFTGGFRPCGVLQTAISPPGLDRTEGATFWQETDGCIRLESWRGSGSSSAQSVGSCSRLETGDIRLDHHRADATIRGTN